MSDSKSTLLEEYTRFSSTPSWSRILRYMLQGEARRLLPLKHRTRICQRLVAQGKENVEIYANAKQHVAYYKNLIVCGSLWSCPVCASRITEVRRSELKQAVENINARTVMITYTVQHVREESLRTVKDALLKAYAFMWSGRWKIDFQDEWGFIGAVRSLEVTFGENGYHPHFHVLAFFNTDASVEMIEQEMQDQLRWRWRESLTKFGRWASYDHGLQVSVDFKDIDEYVSKFGCERLDDINWDVTKEVVKGPAKFGRLHGFTSNEMLLECYRENFLWESIWLRYVQDMVYSHQLQWSPGLRELASLDKLAASDKVLSEGLPDGLELFAVLSREKWSYILDHNLRGEILQIAARGDIEALYDFFERLGVRWDVMSLSDF